MNNNETRVLQLLELPEALDSLNTNAMGCRCFWIVAEVVGGVECDRAHGGVSNAVVIADTTSAVIRVPLQIGVIWHGAIRKALIVVLDCHLQVVRWACQKFNLQHISLEGSPRNHIQTWASRCDRV